MQSTTHTNTHRTGTAAAALRHRWPVLALGICALLALAILAVGASPTSAAPALQNSNPTFPEGAIPPLVVPENSAPDTNVGDPIPAVINSEGDEIYQLHADDKDNFKINTTTRQISVGAAADLDHETNPTYQVMVQVTDHKDAAGNADGQIDDTINVTINVTDLIEPPEKPAAPNISAPNDDGDTTLEISWTAPENTGPPITDYDVRYRAGSSGDFTDADYHGTGTSTTVDGLQSDTAYEVQVRARNDEGDGQWSESGIAQTDSATTPCVTELDIDQDDEKTPGTTVDITLRFEPTGCDPTGDGDLHDEITITLSEEIAIPSGFDEDDVSLRAARRYELRWTDVNRNDDEPHEIVLPGCGGWESGSDDAVCDETGLPVTIVLNNLRLPDVPADSDDPYEVTIQWENGPPFRGKVAVDASLEVDGDDEVGYGETIRFEGLGFSDGLTVDLYAISSTSNNMDCSTAGGGSWTRIGSATVGSNHRFRADVEVGTNLFRSAGKYWICARDGGGVFNVTSAAVTITAGLEITGSSEVSPGGEVTSASWAAAVPGWKACWSPVSPSVSGAKQAIPCA